MVYFYVLFSKNIFNETSWLSTAYLSLCQLSRWNSWLETLRFHLNCIHLRGAVFIHVG